MVEQLLALACIAIGAVLVGFALRHLLPPSPRSQWLATQARIVRSTTMRTGEGYQPDIAYRYEVDGQSYQSSAIGPAFVEVSNLRVAERLSRRVRVGPAAVAYVNPTNPAEAYLQIRPPRLLLVAILLGGALLVALGATRVAP